MYSKKSEKQQNFADFQYFFAHFKDLSKKPIHKSSPRSQNLDPIGSAVLIFIGYKHTDKQSVFIDSVSYISRDLTILTFGEGGGSIPIWGLIPLCGNFAFLNQICHL